MKPETIYIYKEPFNGVILSTMHNGLVDYTGDRVEEKSISENGSQVIRISFENKLNLAQYIEQEGYNPDTIKTATNKEIDKLWIKHEEEQRTDWKEITEERFDDMLNVLPPVRYTRLEKGCFFFISEAYSGSNHSCFTQFRGNYYESLRSVKESTDSIYKSLRDMKEVAAS